MTSSMSRMIIVCSHSFGRIVGRFEFKSTSEALRDRKVLMMHSSTTSSKCVGSNEWSKLTTHVLEVIFFRHAVVQQIKDVERLVIVAFGRVYFH